MTLVSLKGFKKLTSLTVLLQVKMVEPINPISILPHCFSLPSQLKHLTRVMMVSHQGVLPCQCQLFVAAKKSELIEVHSDGNKPHQIKFLFQSKDHSGC